MTSVHTTTKLNELMQFTFGDRWWGVARPIDQAGSGLAEEQASFARERARRELGFEKGDDVRREMM